jgi:hypothetical protein
MSLGRSTAGRRHAHFLLPHAALGDTERDFFDSTLRSAGWSSDPTADSALSMRWQREGYVLRLHTLGWFPLLVTVGPVGGPSRAHRDAVARLTGIVQGHRGKVLSDRQLVEYLPQAGLRWRRALTEQRRLDRAEQMLQARHCKYCGAWADQSATHCPSCEHRYTSAEDAERDQAIDHAATVISSAEKVLADLARGVLLDGLSPPPTRDLTEATSVVIRHA